MPRKISGIRSIGMFHNFPLTYLKIVVCLVSQRRVESGNVASKLGWHVNAETLPILRAMKNRDDI